MKNLSLIAFVCSIMIPFSMQAQSANTGSINRRHGDVQNIGNRNVSGRIFGVLPNQVPLEEEPALGQQMATEFEQTAKLLKDPVITEYIGRLGRKLVQHSDARVPFHIKVVDADAADILVLPGGSLYVNKGLILEAENESELAGVMAHGIAHVCARHATELQSKKNYLQLSNSTISAGEPLSIHYSYSSGVVGSELLSITRDFEIEADLLGIQYLWNTGYDPNAFVSWLEKEPSRREKQSGAFCRMVPHLPLHRGAHSQMSGRAESPSEKGFIYQKLTRVR